MKKKFLNNQVAFNTMMDVNRDWKTGKIEAGKITEEDKEVIKNNLIKGERISYIDFNTVVIETDCHRTEIKKYGGFWAVTEAINFFASAFHQVTNYYKLKR